ncbi:MAG: HD domain-containing protein [Pirellula sp.]|jgi:HD-GYP domain-containing protein (c-di-GMP phosphodiesterase class II)|nr:HD domain-containing protein [Pirellula sp.]
MTSESVEGMRLYIKDEQENYVLYREAELPIDQDDIQRLKKRGVRWLYIEDAAKETYRERMRAIAFGNTPVPTSTRIAAISGIVRDAMETTFATNDDEIICNATKTLSNVAANMICREDFGLKDILPVLHHDYGTFTHSTNVSYYSGVLADALGYSRDDVEEIVRGALLHDLGKLDIDIKILNKPDKLTDREFRIIKQHPIQGFVRLTNQPGVTFGQLMMTYQHHEKLDGSGYPVGIGADEIHPWAKICSVADVFEALTSHRPYRKPMPTPSALAILERGIDNTFDGEIVSCWKSLIKKNSTLF